MGAHEVSDRIEILSVSLLDEHRPTVESLHSMATELRTGFGWHYLLDLTWASEILKPAHGQYVLDAGAGLGIMQWWLAAQGVNVLSVDRRSRASLDWHFRSWCRVTGLRTEDLGPAKPLTLVDFLPPSRYPLDLPRWPGKLRDTFKRIRHANPSPPRERGSVTIYNQDLATMNDIPDGSLDAIVSISALEHNTLEGLCEVVTELMRVLKSGGILIATLGAARDSDWFHDPSRGWCLTENTLRRLFDLPEGCPSNYYQYDSLFETLRDCAELRDNLSRSYFRSGNNGMPWGVWDPKYQPVGIVKRKTPN